MSSLGTSYIDFDLEGIFPTCIKKYNELRRQIHIPEIDPFNNVCSLMKKELGLKNNGFYHSCIYLSNYLKHIEINESNNRKSYCKYFNFVLKYDLDYLNLSCGGETKCYHKMMNVSNGFSKNNIVSSICKDYIEDINEHTFLTLKKLNDLYYNEHIFLSENKECPRDGKCFKNYKELCTICQNSNNESLRSLLEKYKDQHLKNVEDAPSCIEPSKFIYSSSGTSIRTVLLTSFIITIAIPFIAFTLYEYTPCGLYLQPSIRKLKELWNKKMKDEHQLINTFENTYDELVDKWSQISYSTIDCN